MEQRFSFKTTYKIPLIILIITGIIALVYGILTYSNQPGRIWVNVLLSNYFVLALSLSGVFFIAVHVLGQSGWHTSIQRIPEAMGAYLPIAFIGMIIVLFGVKDIYHWAHNTYHDAILTDKKAYLNIPFFILRMVIYFAGWIILGRSMWRASINLDRTGDLKWFRKHTTYSALFVVFFAITISASSWDWLMSIDVHWFSTLYGWYIFSGLLVSGIAMIILLLIILRSLGYFQHVNDEHFHDLGKYLFAFSIFWTYLWFSQYMLIWYSNIPEETKYFVQRLEDYQLLFFINVGINFFIPFMILMTRGSKRRTWIMLVVSIIVLGGHWLDFYLAVMPGTLGKEAGIGFLEMGLTLGFIGIFLWIVFQALTKASLIPEKHPYYRESLEYENL